MGFFKKGDVVRVTAGGHNYPASYGAQGIVDEDDSIVPWVLFKGERIAIYDCHLELVQHAASIQDVDRFKPADAVYVPNQQPPVDDRALEYIKAAVIEKLGETHTTIVDYRAGYVQALRDVLEEVYGLRVVREAIRFEPVDEVA